MTLQILLLIAVLLMVFGILGRLAGGRPPSIDPFRDHAFGREYVSAPNRDDIDSGAADGADDLPFAIAGPAGR